MMIAAEAFLFALHLPRLRLRLLIPKIDKKTGISQRPIPGRRGDERLRPRLAGLRPGATLITNVTAESFRLPEMNQLFGEQETV
jgi:hypothetical protein